MIPVQFVLVGAAFNLAGLSSYVADTLRGRNRPNRVSWFLWALAPLIAFAAEVGQGVGLQSLMTFMVGFGPAVVLGASFVSRHGAARLTRFDLGCGSLSLVALVMWRITGQGDVAIAFSVAADLLAGVPTIRKAYRDPASESWPAFACSSVERGAHAVDHHHLDLRRGRVPRLHPGHQRAADRADPVPDAATRLDPGRTGAGPRRRRWATMSRFGPRAAIVVAADRVPGLRPNGDGNPSASGHASRAPGAAAG